jgi:Holliday junction resolvasome RuvABC endonuclease subunit
MMIVSVPYANRRSRLKSFGVGVGQLTKNKYDKIKSMKALLRQERDPEKYKTIMGIDSSSTGVAYTIVRDGTPIKSGKITLTHLKETPDKLMLVSTYMKELLPGVDHVFVEKSIFVANPATARLLANIVGGIMLMCAMSGVGVTDVEPATWKSFIGYTNLSSKFQKQATEVLGVTEGRKLCNTMRKSQTQRLIKHNFPHFDIEDNDISDSCAIALYGYDKVVKPLAFEKSKSIAVDLAALAQLGLTF